MKNVVSLILLIAIAPYCIAQKTHLAIKARPDTTHSGWVYDKPDTDKFTSRILYTAYIMNDGETYYSYAYKGKAMILIENDQDVNVFILRFEKPVKKNANDSIIVTIKFDGGKEQLYAFAFPDNSSSDIIRDCGLANEIIEKLKTTKKFKVHIKFSDGDIGAYGFNVAGLKWNYRGKDKREKEIIH